MSIMECGLHLCMPVNFSVITKEECQEADQKLMRFCVMFEALCGKEKCTPNMHLHGHLQDCILDYGPVSHSGAFHLRGTMESWEITIRTMLTLVSIV